MTDQQAKAKALLRLRDGRRKAQRALHRIVRQEVKVLSKLNPAWMDYGVAAPCFEATCVAIEQRVARANIGSALWKPLNRHRVIALIGKAAWGQI